MCSNEKVTSYILGMKKDISDLEIEEFLNKVLGKDVGLYPEDYNNLLSTFKYYRTGVSDSVLSLDSYVIANIVYRPEKKSSFNLLHSKLTAPYNNDRIFFTFIEG